MFRKSAVCWMVLVGWALLAAGCGDKRTPMDKTLALLPPDTGVLMSFQLSRLAGTPLMDEIEKEFLETKGLGEVLRESNLRLTENIQTLTVAVPNDTSPLRQTAPAQVTAVMLTTLSDTFLDEVMTRSTHSFQKEMSGKTAVWVNRNEQVPIALVSLPKGVLGFGSFESVGAMIERSQKKAPGLTSKSPLFAKAGDLNTEAAVWGVAEFSGALRQEAQANPLTSGLGPVHHLKWMGDYDAAEGLTVAAQGVCDSESEATQVQTSLQLLLEMASLNSRTGEPWMQEVLGTMRLEVSDRAVVFHFTLSPEVLARFSRRTETPGPKPES